MKDETLGGIDEVLVLFPAAVVLFGAMLNGQSTGQCQSLIHAGSARTQGCLVFGSWR